MNKLEAEVIRQAALLVCETTRKKADRIEIWARLTAMTNALGELYQYRISHKKSAKKTAKPARVLPAGNYARSIPKYL